MPDPNLEKTYIGDGVYASFDGYQIWIETDRGDGFVHKIAIEAEVMGKLAEYADACWLTPARQAAPEI